MTTKLEDASKLMKELEKDREKKFGELTEHLKKAGEQTALLRKLQVLSVKHYQAQKQGDNGEKEWRKMFCDLPVLLKM